MDGTQALVYRVMAPSLPGQRLVLVDTASLSCRLPVGPEHGEPKGHAQPGPNQKAFRSVLRWEISRCRAE